MRARRSLGHAALALVVVVGSPSALLLASCQDPTQITALVGTNVPFRPNVTMALWSSAGGQIAPGTQPQALYREPWLADGRLGDLVITPSGAKDGPVTIQAVLGIDRDPATCTATDAKGCVVSRRKLAFVPHTRLRVPLVLHLACDGVVCSQDTTCDYLGKCVPAAVNPDACASPAGCSLPGDETVKPAASASPADAPTSAPDAAAPKSVRVSAGYDHSCAVRDGVLKCWGGNDNGILGLGDIVGRGAGSGQLGAALPAVDLGPGRLVKLAAPSNNHTCALLDDAAVKCWGANTSGLLGLGDARPRGGLPGEMGAALPAVNVAPGRTVMELTAGNDHTCVLFEGGLVKCWGANLEGQLGLGDVTPRGASPGDMGAALAVVDLGPGRTATSLAAGNNHTCAVLDDARVKCWGGNEDGQLGLGDTNRRGGAPGQMGVNLPAVDLGGRPAARVAAGNKFTCAILVDGGVVCWGRNTYGQLGTGDRVSRGRGPGELGAALPTLNLGAGRTVRQVGLGDNHVCARLDNGALKCWGRNSSKGELGLGDTSDRGGQPGDLGDNLPTVNLGPSRTVLDVGVGLRHTCVALDDRSVKCWGENSFGQLGQGNTTDLGASPAHMGAALKPVPLD